MFKLKGYSENKENSIVIMEDEKYDTVFNSAIQCRDILLQNQNAFNQNAVILLSFMEIVDDSNKILWSSNGIDSYAELSGLIDENKKKVLYRTEEAYGSGERDIIDVMTYETFELQNTDILKYISENYKLNGFLQKKAGLLLENETAFDHMTKEDWHTFYADAVTAINQELGKNLKYCLWLTSIEAVRDIYNGTEIDAYQTSTTILSDINYDGTLYAYEEEPERIEKKINEPESNIQFEREL